MSPSPLARLTLIPCAAVLLATSSVRGQTLIDVGRLQPGHAFTGSAAVSADGTTVIGGSGTGFFDHMRGFRWTASGGMQDIGAPPNTVNIFAQAVNANGTAIVGSAYGSNDVAFLWTPSGGVQDLGALPGSTYGADGWGISYDGTVAAGSSGSANGDRAFRWTAAGGMQDLGTLTGGTYSAGFALSGNGQAVTGWADSPAGEHAYRWTAASGMVDLGSLNPAEPSGGFAISADGSVIAGYSGNSAVIWNGATVHDLGLLPGGTSGVAYCVSGDGLVAGGLADSSTQNSAAFLWTSALGMVDLNTYFPSIGISLTGWTLTTTTGLSYDGRTITGIGTYNGEDRAWVVTIPSPTTSGAALLGSLMFTRRRRR